MQTHYVDEKPLKELLRDLSSDSVHLVRQETTLFKKEMEAKLEKVQKSAVVLGAGAGLALAGALTLTAAVVLLLRHVMPDFVAAGLVAIAYLIGGAVLLTQGKRSLSGQSVKPEETVDSVTHDVRTIRRAIS